MQKCLWLIQHYDSSWCTKCSKRFFGTFVLAWQMKEPEWPLMISAPCDRLLRTARYLINILYLYFHSVWLELRFDRRDLVNWISHYRSGLQTRWLQPRRVLCNTTDSWLAPVPEWEVSQSDLQPGEERSWSATVETGLFRSLFASAPAN